MSFLDKFKKSDGQILAEILKDTKKEKESQPRDSAKEIIEKFDERHPVLKTDKDKIQETSNKEASENKEAPDLFLGYDKKSVLEQARAKFVVLEEESDDKAVEKLEKNRKKWGDNSYKSWINRLMRPMEEEKDQGAEKKSVSEKFIVYKDKDGFVLSDELKKRLKISKEEGAPIWAVYGKGEGRGKEEIERLAKEAGIEIEFFDEIGRESKVSGQITDKEAREASASLGISDAMSRERMEDALRRGLAQQKAEEAENYESFIDRHLEIDEQGDFKPESLKIKTEKKIDAAEELKKMGEEAKENKMRLKGIPAKSPEEKIKDLEKQVGIKPKPFESEGEILRKKGEPEKEKTVLEKEQLVVSESKVKEYIDNKKNISDLFLGHNKEAVLAQAKAKITDFKDKTEGEILEKLESNRKKWGDDFYKSWIEKLLEEKKVKSAEKEINKTESEKIRDDGNLKSLIEKIKNFKGKNFYEIILGRGSNVSIEKGYRDFIEKNQESGKSAIDDFLESFSVEEINKSSFLKQLKSIHDESPFELPGEDDFDLQEEIEIKEGIDLEKLAQDDFSDHRDDYLDLFEKEPGNIVKDFENNLKQRGDKDGVWFLAKIGNYLDGFLKEDLEDEDNKFLQALQYLHGIYYEKKVKGVVDDTYKSHKKNFEKQPRSFSQF